MKSKCVPAKTSKSIVNSDRAFSLSANDPLPLSISKASKPLQSDSCGSTTSRNTPSFLQQVLIQAHAHWLARGSAGVGLNASHEEGNRSSDHDAPGLRMGTLAKSDGELKSRLGSKPALSKVAL